MSRDSKELPLGRVLHPGPAEFKQMSEEQLAEYMAREEPMSKGWLLASNEAERRASWSGPVRLSLVMSALALIISVAAMAIGD